MCEEESGHFHEIACHEEALSLWGRYKRQFDRGSNVNENKIASGTGLEPSALALGRAPYMNETMCVPFLNKSMLDLHLEAAHVFVR